MNFANKYWGCHQMPERSYSIHGYQLPVCARCTGIILGEILSATLFLLGVRLSVTAYIALMILLVLDGTVQYATKYCSTNIKRLLSGLLFGYGFIGVILLGLYNIF